MKVLRNLFAAIMLFGSSIANASEKTSFDRGWKFYLGDVKEASASVFNDSKWRTLDLPHDWSIEAAVDRNAPSGNDGGYLSTGIGWYRKTFTAPKETNKKTWLYFEGVYERSEIYLNGELVGGHPYGYTSFYCDVTKQIKPGKQNVVAVRVDNSQQKNSRWYTGSGIYRHVWLVTSNKLHIKNYGVQTKYKPEENKLYVLVGYDNETGTTNNKATLRVTIPGIGTQDCSFNVTPNEGEASIQFNVNNPKLWSVDSPYLYTATVELIENGKTTDKVEQTFGIRTVEYSTEGFKLNGKLMKLNGCCVHHDNGILGAAAYDRADYRRVELLKAAGYNAVRTSHNPPSEAFLDACDKIGLLVIDESFDGWRDAKNKHDYSTLFDKWWKEDVQAMVKRDRNHPSIFCWSIGNEVIERKKIEIVTTAHKLSQAVKECDIEKRPVTSALAAWDRDWEIYDPLAAQLDIVGYNYMMHKAEGDHQRVPDRVMMQTESYPKDAFANWARMTDHSYIIGDFVWTSLDYIGESGIGRWWYEGETPGEHYQRPLFPWHGSFCGDIDLIGFTKPIGHYRNILNEGTGEMMYMAVKEPNGYKGKIAVGLWGVWPTWECWNWPGHEGKDIDVEIYSRCSSVRLYLDNNLIGEKPTTRKEEFKAIFTLPYKAGELKAEGIENGKVVTTQVLKTAGKPVTLKATADRTELTADGQDLSFITIEALDADGNVVPNAACDLQASIKGAAAIAATGNADLQDTIPYNSLKFRTWKGRALVVVKSQYKDGNATLTLTSPEMKSATVQLRTKK